MKALLVARDRFVEDALGGLSPEENTALAGLMRRVEANVSKLAGLPAIGENLNIDPARPEDDRRLEVAAADPERV